MRLSGSAHKLYAEFFSECELCEVVEFPKIEVYVRRGSWLLTNTIMVDGITFGRHVFINPKLTSRTEDGLLTISKELIAHELVHVLQYRREGMWLFFWNYVSDFARAFRKKKKWNTQTWFETYLDLPHEREAREIASEFSGWVRNRNGSRIN